MHKSKWGSGGGKNVLHKQNSKGKKAGRRITRKWKKIQKAWNQEPWGSLTTKHRGVLKAVGSHKISFIVNHICFVKMPLYEERRGVESAIGVGTWATHSKEVGWIRGRKIVRFGREKNLESRLDRTGWLDDERLKENKKLVRKMPRTSGSVTRWTLVPFPEGYRARGSRVGGRTWSWVFQTSATSPIISR